MPNFNIDSFKANFVNGAKQYLFYIYLDNPIASGNMDKNVYLVSASSLPEGTIDPIETQWQGQTYKFGSTHTFADWNVTFKVDAKARIRTEFEDWQKIIHDPETNIHGNPSDYMRTQKITMLDGVGTPIKSKLLVDAWPTTMSEITLDYASKEIATFDVTFSYLYYKND